MYLVFVCCLNVATIPDKIIGTNNEFRAKIATFMYRESANFEFGLAKMKIMKRSAN